jgi:hypothetical protein
VPPQIARPSAPAVTTTPVQSAVDPAIVKSLLDSYFAASGAFDEAGLRRVYPNPPPWTIDRLNAQRKEFDRCDYGIKNIRSSASSDASARIQVDIVESCTPKTARQPIQLRTQNQFDLGRDSSGSWVILKHAMQ